MIFSSLGAPPERIRMLVYADPSVDVLDFALGFPRPGVLDPIGSVNAKATRFPNARARYVNTVNETRVALRDLAANPAEIDTLILDNFSATCDRIDATYITEQKHVYYVQRRMQTLAIIRQTADFPGDVILIARSKPVWGKAGDISARTSAGDERILVGTQADIDDACAYILDVVIELLHDVDGVTRAIVRKSNREAFSVGEIIDAPTYEAFAIRLGRISSPVAIDESVVHYPLNPGEFMMLTGYRIGEPAPAPIDEADVIPEPSREAIEAATAAVAELVPRRPGPKMAMPTHLRPAV